jgi:hypothetical protein
MSRPTQLLRAIRPASNRALPCNVIYSSLAQRSVTTSTVLSSSPSASTSTSTTIRPSNSIPSIISHSRSYSTEPPSAPAPLDEGEKAIYDKLSASFPGKRLEVQDVSGEFESRYMHLISYYPGFIGRSCDTAVSRQFHSYLRLLPFISVILSDFKG